jgi:hypothetical protein
MSSMIPLTILSLDIDETVDTEEHISEYANQGLRTLCMAKRVIQIILSKYIYSLPPIFVVSAKCIDPWALEFVVSNTTGLELNHNCPLTHITHLN